MSKLSKAVRKAARSVKKHLGKHWWVPGYNLVKGQAEIFGSLYDEYKRNEGMYNRLGLMIGGAILTGGALGAMAGATGIGGLTAATGATAGATSGAVGGATAAGASAYQEHQQQKAIEEQEAAQREYEQRMEALRRAEEIKAAASTPEQTASTFNAYSSRGSQIMRTRVSRSGSNKKVGGSSSTVG